MRRFVLLLLVVLLGSGAVGAGAWSASAQQLERIEDCPPLKVPPQLGLGVEESYYWEGVCQPIPPDERVPAPIGGDLIMQPYTVYLAEDFAAIPDASSGQFRPEYMVVVVRKGTFALDVKDGSPGKIDVYGAGNEIPLLSPFDDREPYYAARPREVLTDREGNPCVRGCEVPPNTVVQLGPGDRVVAEEGAICVYCLLGTNEVRGDETGLLEVFVLRQLGDDPSTFSWIESWNRAERAELPLVRRSDSPTVLGWAYFDPKTGCKDG